MKYENIKEATKICASIDRLKDNRDWAAEELKNILSSLKNNEVVIRIGGSNLWLPEKVVEGFCKESINYYDKEIDKLKKELNIL